MKWRSMWGSRTTSKETRRVSMHRGWVRLRLFVDRKRLGGPVNLTHAPENLISNHGEGNPMRSCLLFMFTISALAVGCGPQTEASAAFEEPALIQEVLETLERFTEAMNSHDPERVFSFYRQDPTFFFLGCTDILYGWDAFASRVGPYYQFNTDVTFEQEVLSVQILSPTVAVAALRGSSTEAEALFWTEVLQRQDDGRWLITHEHESWPGCPVPRGPHMGTTGESQDSASALEPLGLN